MFAGMRMGQWVALLALALAACSESRHTVSIRIVSDLTPSFEARRATIEWLSMDATSERQQLAHVERDIRATDPLARGLNAATFTDVPSGTYKFDVSLWRGNGQRIAGRPIVVDVHADATYTVVITADCASVQCPSAGGSPALSACLAGQCVDPRCTTDTPEYCPEFDFCDTSMDCIDEDSTPCATPMCTDGVCIQTPSSDQCASTEYCARDIGCAPIDGPMMPSASNECGKICLQTIAPCWYGYIICAEDAEPTCTPFVQRPSGAPCGDDMTCNAQGTCTPTTSMMDGGMPDATLVDAARDATSDAPRDATQDLATATDGPVTLLDAADAYFEGTNDAAPDAVEESDGSVTLLDASALPDATPDAAPAEPTLITDTANFILTEFGRNDVAVGVRLSAAPTSSQRYMLTLNSGASFSSSSDSIGMTTVLFSTSNWNTWQYVHVYGVDDAMDDGDVFGTITAVRVEPTTGTSFTLSSYVNVDDEGTERMSRVPGVACSIGSTPWAPVLSPDGRYLLFSVFTADAVLTGGAPCTDGAIYMLDRTDYSFERITHDSSGGCGSLGSFSNSMAMSNDNRYVFFASSSSDFDASDVNGTIDVYRFDRMTDEYLRMSPTYMGGNANANIELNSISGDGRFLTFTTSANNMTIEPDTNGTFDVFLYDADEDEIVLLSKHGSTTGSGFSSSAFISVDGSFVMFSSIDRTIVDGFNAYVYRYDVGTEALSAFESLNYGAIPTLSDTRLLHTTGGGIRVSDLDGTNTINIARNSMGTPLTTDQVTPMAIASHSGPRVLSVTRYTGIIPGVDSNDYDDCYIFDAVGTEPPFLLTQNLSGESGLMGGAYSVVCNISADGTAAAFSSYSIGFAPEYGTCAASASGEIYLRALSTP